MKSEKAALYAATEKLERLAKKQPFIDARTKVCRVCKQEKSKLEFYASSQNVDGFTTICKPCAIIYRKPNYRKNREKVKEQVKAWKKKNIEKHRAYQAHYTHEYNLKYPEKRKSQGRSHYAKKIGK